MPPKKKAMPPPWVASSPAPAKVTVRVPSVKELSKFTSSDLRGIFFTVEGIDQTHFDKLATENFSSWEDVRTSTTLRVAAESSTPEVSPPESAAKSNISKRHAAQGLRAMACWRGLHKDKKHATYEATRDVRVR
jgi:hypothetical protein